MTSKLRTYFNRCSYCGRFISYKDLANEKKVGSENLMEYDSSPYTPDDCMIPTGGILYYHIKCEVKNKMHY